ncbi:MAG: hypothetical protein V5A44_02125, partial [Haloarculaceae archaeon]
MRADVGSAVGSVAPTADQHGDDGHPPCGQPRRAGDASGHPSRFDGRRSISCEGAVTDLELSVWVATAALRGCVSREDGAQKRRASLLPLGVATPTAVLAVAVVG